MAPEDPELAGVAAETAATAASIAKVEGQIEAVVEEERALRRDQPDFWRGDLNRLRTENIAYEELHAQEEGAAAQKACMIRSMSYMDLTYFL